MWRSDDACDIPRREDVCYLSNSRQLELRSNTTSLEAEGKLLKTKNTEVLTISATGTLEVVEGTRVANFVQDWQFTNTSTYRPFWLCLTQSHLQDEETESQGTFIPLVFHNLTLSSLEWKCNPLSTSEQELREHVAWLSHFRIFAYYVDQINLRSKYNP